MPKTLITAWEVVKYSPVSNKFPTAYVNGIYRKEISFARKWLGKDFYDLLIADLVDYGEVKNWTNGETYALNEYVDYLGLILRSKAADNGADPCTDDGTNWEEAKKFQDTTCYEPLWTDGSLREYLALYIMQSVLVTSTIQAGAKGVTEWLDDNTGTKSASKNTLLTLKEQIIQDANESLENLQCYIWDNKDDCDFSKVKFIAEQKTVNKTRPLQRFNFRRR